MKEQKRFIKGVKHLLESEIIERLKSRDQQALRDLYDVYFDYAIRTATIVMNHNNSYAEDAVQETFIKVYQNIHLYHSDRPFKPWFYKILLNECNRILKRNSKVVSVEEVRHEHDQTEETYLHHLLEYEVLYLAIQKLELHNQIPIVLKYLNGFKEQEIAEILDENVNTIKSRLYKGRQKLRKYLEAEKEVN
ncbi:RNA polymerase sigma factor [Paraliobacillus quinghaiensis]|uniref:RNA polymerase sigma factor n=1 Tax=Paraliobacillus quinghaiensis TaxID=470815 RepID=UPI0019674CBE|nr:sigma-70 family RNA polymerase sigma factor [Paraliobacillus quinghaiensis]